MVDIPSRSRSSPSINSMTHIQRSYYPADSPRSPSLNHSPMRSRSPHRSLRMSESPPSIHSKYEDGHSIAIVEPVPLVKREDADCKTDVVRCYVMSPILIVAESVSGLFLFYFVFNLFIQKRIYALFLFCFFDLGRQQSKWIVSNEPCFYVRLQL